MYSTQRIISLLIVLLLTGSTVLTSQSEPIPPQESGDQESPPTDKTTKKPKKSKKKVRKAALAALPSQYQLWLESVDLIMSKEELDSFLELNKDYQRDAFIERFWKARDPYPQTPTNEARERWEAASSAP